MDKYVGQYRVIIEKDIRTGENLENTYIKCKHGGQIYRYNDNILVAYIPSTVIGKRLVEELKYKLIKYDYGNKEYRLYFKEEYINEFAETMKASTQGKDIKPGNKRKSHDPSKVTEEGRRRILERLGKLKQNNDR